MALPTVYPLIPVYDGEGWNADIAAYQVQITAPSAFEILQAYCSRHRYRIAMPESFLAVIESVTDNRHQDIFEKWITESVE